MAIRRDFIHESLADLDGVAAELEKHSGATAVAMARDLSLRWTVERGLLAGLTLVFQVCEHILAAHFHRYPETYEGLLQELRDAGVLPPAVYERLKGSGGFRAPWRRRRQRARLATRLRRLVTTNDGAPPATS